MAFKPVDTRVSFPALEDEVASWWSAAGIVRQSLESGDRSRPFIFFEGPPTANGRPGVHHVEARVTKDVVVRYHRLRGQHVIGARGGWDTHGLPVEIEVESEKGFSGKPDIEKYGIEAFNEACKESVWRYIKEFERLTDRIAYWLDLSDPYVTYHNNYIESLWWIFKTLWDRGLLFRDYKVTMHCPRCGTSLSDHEVAQGFEDNVDDPSVWLRFRLKAPASSTDGSTDLPHPHAAQLAGASMLAWTTTPWTLPANVALAVNPEANYVLAEYQDERLVLAEALAARVLGEDYTALATFTGEQLVGLHYENLFKGVPGPGDTVRWETAYRVVADDFVTLEDGTGVVHIAPAYGDLEIGRKYGLPTLFSVDLAGKVLPEFADLGVAGMFFKDADPLITRNLKERGLLFKSERVRHTYPFCWRCKTPLLYYAKRSWYIRTTAMKDRLIDNNNADQLGAGAYQAWALRQLARKQYRLGGQPRTLLGHAAADLDLRRLRRSRSDRLGRGTERTCWQRYVQTSICIVRMSTRRRGVVRRAAAARCSACPMSPMPGSIRVRCRSRSGIIRSRTARSSSSRNRPTSSPRRSIRRVAGSTRCTRFRRCCSTVRRFRM